MSIRKFIVAAFVGSALFALPLVANAASTFYNVSGIAKGTATATFTDILPADVATGKRTNTVIKFTNGVIDPTVNANVFADGNNDKFSLNNALTVAYPAGSEISVETDNYNILRTGKGKASGIAYWYFNAPTLEYARNHATTTGKMWYMYGDCRVDLAVNPTTNKGVFKTSQMVPEEAKYFPYTSDGLGNVSSVTGGPWIPTDGKFTMPSMNVTLIPAP